MKTNLALMHAALDIAPWKDSGVEGGNYGSLLIMEEKQIAKEEKSWREAVLKGHQHNQKSGEKNDKGIE